MRILLLAVAFSTVLGCAAPIQDRGSHQIGILVVNESSDPVHLLIGNPNFGGAAGPPTGHTVPDQISAGGRADVALYVPGDRAWGFFVNAGQPHGGMVFGSIDVGSCTGKLNAQVTIDVAGLPSWAPMGALC
jgi:hypothetical protein